MYLRRARGDEHQCQSLPVWRWDEVVTMVKYSEFCAISLSRKDTASDLKFEEISSFYIQNWKERFIIRASGNSGYCGAKSQVNQFAHLWQEKLGMLLMCKVKSFSLTLLLTHLWATLLEYQSECPSLFSRNLKPCVHERALRRSYAAHIWRTVN